ncbi:MAG: hypothetical protein K2H74_04795 [Paramuribaculum sp.]|nr:hypothetical protein [Paramuribaculum sp.]
MKQIDNLLTPDEGMMFTQAADVPIESRIVTDRVYLAVNDSADNWLEITNEEAASIRFEQEAIIETRIDQHK